MEICAARRLSLLFLVSVIATGGFFSALHAQVEETQIQTRRAQLEDELAGIEKEIEAQQTLLQDKQRERVSLERDVAILDAKIEKAHLSIRARDLAIRKLTGEIEGKEAIIGDLSDKLEREKQSLAQLIRKTNEVDHISLVEIILGNHNLSDFFEDLDIFDSIKVALADSFVEIESTRTDTESQKLSLEDKQAAEIELRGIQVLEKKKIEGQEDEKQRILTITKGVEGVYQDIIKTKEKSAAEIRTELFTLRGTAAIPFGEALAFANTASAKTGVRSALILGVIAEESNLGENIGTGSWQTDMHPTRDRPIFEDITSALGLDPDKMPVSKKAWYGWGGAMGPAQFIPSTWVHYGGFVKNDSGGWEYSASKDRIRNLTGKNKPSDPWDPETAFMASATLLMDNGADRGTFYSERLAALRYFAGWKNAEKSSYAFYGDEVMELAAKYQRQIDILQSA
jgi:peptidoglycan hydrolase CwlO-like protein